jgi:hypothetical protein
LREISTYGYDEVARQTFFGLRTHLRVCCPGVIADHRWVAANVHEVPVAVDMPSTAQGFVLGDRNYWNPDVFAEMQKQALFWIAYKSSQREKQPFPKVLKHKRYRIETVIGQFVERYRSKKIWARDT